MNSTNKILIPNNKSFVVNTFQYKKSLNLFNKLLLPNPHFKEEILFSHKTQKELLLSHIKETQVKLISKIKKINNNVQIYKLQKINLLKDLLFELKQNLSYILNEKKKNEKYLQNKVNKIKKNIQINLFNKEKAHMCLGIDEIAALKILNFKIENEIKKIDFLLDNKSDLNKYLKIVNIFPEQNRELYFNNIENNNEIEHIFNLKKKENKEILIQTQKNYDLQKSIIEQIKNEINIYKKKLEIKKHISLKDIIFEDSLENKIITSISNCNCYDKRKSNCSDNNDDINKFFYDIKKNNKNEDINNNVKNILNFNMNINLNINTNQYFSNIVVKKD